MGLLPRSPYLRERQLHEGSRDAVYGRLAITTYHKSCSLGFVACLTVMGSGATPTALYVLWFCTAPLTQDVVALQPCPVWRLCDFRSTTEPQPQEVDAPLPCPEPEATPAVAVSYIENALPP